jgi:alanine racemase
MNRCTKAIIYKSNLEYNIRQIRNFVEPGVKLCIAVKADSYGHNAVLTSKIAEGLAVEYLAVASVGEGVELRHAGIKAHILLLSLCVPEEFNDLFEYELTPLVFSKEYITALSEAADGYFKRQSNKNLKHSVFLAVDTGMGRIGTYPETAGDESVLINSSAHLKLAGMCTHLAVSDSLSPSDQEFTDDQFKAFKLAVENVRAKGIDPGICSCEASAGLLNNPEMQMDMVRPGIIAYGYYPDEITEKYLKSKGFSLKLKPCLSLETKVVAIRSFPAGKSVSYGRTWETPCDTDIAVLPIGYADGLLRRFSPGLTVTINGKNYPVVGRICMDQCMVDIGKNNPDVKLWDRVVIFGPEESGALNTADDLAKIGNTISYEVLTCLKRVEKDIR